jgi:hypothetical protein
MTMFHRIASLIEVLVQSNSHASLLALSDHELAARGLSRDGLIRCYISGLGAR